MDIEYYQYWKERENKLKCFIENKQFEEALKIVERTKEIEISVEDSDYIAYHILTYVCLEEIEKAKYYINIAFQYHYFRLWYLSPKEDYPNELFKPLHDNEKLQNFIKDLKLNRPNWVNVLDIRKGKKDIEKRPFCSVRKVILNKKSARCFVSKKTIKKGDEIYEITYFSDFTHKYYAFIEAFESHNGVMENLKKFQNNNYQLNDFRHECSYVNPLLNKFWNTLGDFNLEKTLNLISTPLSFPTPYITCHFEKTATPYTAPTVTKYVPSGKSYPVDKADYSKGTWLQTRKASDKYICAGTAGAHINLLWVLVKCGYLENIIELLPKLPNHFPYLLLLFEDKEIRKRIADYVKLPELAELLPIAFKNYSKKKPEETAQLIKFGEKHPNFRTILAYLCNHYEIHLHAASCNEGLNTYLFTEHQRANSIGILDFLICEPKLISSIKEMMENKVDISPFRTGGYYETYEYSVSGLHRIIGLYRFLYKGEKEFWLNLPPEWHKGLYDKIQRDVEKLGKKITSYNKVHKQ